MRRVFPRLRRLFCDRPANLVRDMPFWSNSLVGAFVLTEKLVGPHPWHAVALELYGAGLLASLPLYACYCWGELRGYRAGMRQAHAIYNSRPFEVAGIQLWSWNERPPEKNNGPHHD